MSEVEATNVTETTEETTTEVTEQTEQTDTATELAKLKAEFAKQKAALDKATKEAGDAKKALRAKQTQEEIDADTRKQQEEANQKELEELRMKFAVMESSKAVLTRIGGDESASTRIAEYLYGAKDVDGALTEIQKIIAAREKALRIEYGKVPAPGAGNSDGPTITKEQFAAMGYKERSDLFNKHPDEYNRLMGR